MNRSHKLFFRLGTALTGLAGLGLVVFFALPRDLESIHARIAERYERVQHIDADAFLTMPTDDLIIFDARQMPEFEVSHIAGALQIDPDISADAFVAAYGDRLDGKTVVFYCSVGRRASKLAERVELAAEAAGVEGLYNLTGGIFRWNNEARPLVGADGETTSAVHPYSLFAAPLVLKAENRRYRAVQTGGEEGT